VGANAPVSKFWLAISCHEENITALNKRLNLKQNNRRMILPATVIHLQPTNNT
jgi:hypothetical protein